MFGKVVQRLKCLVKLFRGSNVWYSCTEVEMFGKIVQRLKYLV